VPPVLLSQRWAMALRVRETLSGTNFALNTALHRWPWVGYAAIYSSGMVPFSIYRIVNLSAIIAALPGDEDSTGLQLAGVLFGILQDAVVSSYLALVLFTLDATFNRLSSCNDTAPNGCLDCFTRGLYFVSRLKLVLKRLGRFVFAFAVFGAMVAAVASDAVLIRSRHCRFSFVWLSAYLNSDLGRFPLVMTQEEEQRLAGIATRVTIALAVMFAAMNAVWIDLTRWCPFAQIDWRFVSRPCQRTRRQLTAESLNQPSINYIVIEHGEFFDSDDNQLRGTLSLLGTMPQADFSSIDMGQSKDEDEGATWELTVATAVICVLVLIVLPILLTVVARHLPPLSAHIALNVNVNEPVHGISGFNLYPPGGD